MNSSLELANDLFLRARASKFNGTWNLDTVPSPQEIIELSEYILHLENELHEEAKINAMGGDRELRLLARVSELERELARAFTTNIMQESGR